MEQKLNWDDFRFVLAVERTGSLSAAGRSLKMSHVTVFRRLQSLEKRMGVRLFDRDRSGYTPTPAGERICAAAARMEEELLQAARQVIGQDLTLEGDIRVTATDTFFHGLLIEACKEFRALYPAIKLEILISDQRFNLSKREADVALRPTLSPQESLVGRKLGEIEQAVYGAAGKVNSQTHGLDLSTFEWVGPDATLSYQALDRWIVANDLEEKVVCRINSLIGMREAMLQGLGLTVLPCYLCEPDPACKRIGEPLPELKLDLWMLTHPDLRSVSRIRAFMEFVSEAVKNRLPELAAPPNG